MTLATRGPHLTFNQNILHVADRRAWNPALGLSDRDCAEIALMAELPDEHKAEALRRMRSWRFRLRMWWRRR